MIPLNAATDTGAAGLTSSARGWGKIPSAAGVGGAGSGVTVCAALATWHCVEHWAVDVEATSPPSSTNAATAPTAEATRTRRDQSNCTPVWIGMGRNCRSGSADRAPTIGRPPASRRPYGLEHWLQLGGKFENGDDAVGALLVFAKSGSEFFDGREDSVALVAGQFVGDDWLWRVRADLHLDVGMGAKVEHPGRARDATGG